MLWISVHSVDQIKKYKRKYFAFEISIQICELVFLCRKSKSLIVTNLSIPKDLQGTAGYFFRWCQKWMSLCYVFIL